MHKVNYPVSRLPVLERGVHMDVNRRRPKHKPLYGSSTTKIHYNLLVGDPSAGGRLKHFSFQEQIPDACFNLDISTSDSAVSQWYHQLTGVYGDAILKNGKYSCLMCLKLPLNRGAAAMAHTMLHLNGHPVNLNEECKDRPHSDAAYLQRRFQYEIAELATLGAFPNIAAENRLTVMGGNGPTATTICIPICGSVVCKKMASDVSLEYRDRTDRRLELS